MARTGELLEAGDPAGSNLNKYGVPAAAAKAVGEAMKGGADDPSTIPHVLAPGPAKQAEKSGLGKVWDGIVSGAKKTWHSISGSITEGVKSLNYSASHMGSSSGGGLLGGAGGGISEGILLGG